MTVRQITYYGGPGLEQDVFKDYMSALGYTVQVLSLDHAWSNPPTAETNIIIIASSQPPPELARLVAGLRAAESSPPVPIFILYDGQPFDPGMERVFVLPRPHCFSAVVRRIDSLNKPGP